LLRKFSLRLARVYAQTQAVDERPYRHTADAIRTIYRAEGFPAFYRGLLPSLLGIAHVGVQFPMYEQLKTWARAYAFSLIRASH
jgi:solute carrier family 25 folate transporter 32